MQKVALLSMCPIGMVTALLTSSMVYLYQAYPTFSEATVTLVLTIPNLTVIAGLVLAPILVKKFPIKYLIVFGMILFTAGSALCAWVENFYLMLFLRALSGVGSGLVVPLQNTFIASYPEEERATMLGFNSVMGAVIVAPLAVLSGIIANINWRYVFLLYLVNLIVIIMLVIFLPKHIEQTAQNAQNRAEQKTKTKLSDYSKVLFYYYFMLAGCYLFVTSLSAQLAPYLESLALGGATESGMLVGLSMGGMLVAGIFFKNYVSFLKKMAVPVLFAGCAAGMLLFSLAPNIIVVAVAQLLIGVCSPVITMLVNFELSRALPLELFPVVSAGINFFVFVLQFLAPMLLLAVLGFTGDSFRIVFMIYAIIQAVMLVLSIVLPKVLLNRK